MKIIGVIPARYKSTRFPGKPLADICGKPMIWWVYQQVAKVKELSAVYVATDDQRIADACKANDINVIMTKDTHPDHIARVHECSTLIEADLYVCINGDEPLISATEISKVIAKYNPEYAFCGAYRTLTDPVETIDTGNIKIVLNDKNEALYISRTPVPYPKNNLMFAYKKYVGIECFSKYALDFFVNHPMGLIEKTEDIDHLRFIENRLPICFIETQEKSLSIDTPKDLEKIKAIIKAKQKANNE